MYVKIGALESRNRVLSVRKISAVLKDDFFSTKLALYRLLPLLSWGLEITAQLRAIFQNMGQKTLKTPL